MNNTLAFIIEDEPDLALIFSKAIKTDGMTIEIIPDGLDAVKRLGEDTPNVVVLDMHLPGMDGLEILSHIRSDPRFAFTRVIVATADSNMLDLVERQADIVLLKPVSYNQLRDLASRLLIAQ
jgi:CheY-like chemotaxis protein